MKTLLFIYNVLAYLIYESNEFKFKKTCHLTLMGASSKLCGFNFIISDEH